MCCPTLDGLGMPARAAPSYFAISKALQLVKLMPINFRHRPCPKSLPPKSHHGAPWGCRQGSLQGQAPGFLSLPSLSWAQSILRGNAQKGTDPADTQPWRGCPAAGTGAPGPEDQWARSGAGDGGHGCSGVERGGQGSWGTRAMRVRSVAVSCPSHQCWEQMFSVLARNPAENNRGCTCRVAPSELSSCLCSVFEQQ